MIGLDTLFSNQKFSFQNSYLKKKCGVYISNEIKVFMKLSLLFYELFWHYVEENPPKRNYIIHIVYA